ncbi:MAG: HAMP domain-containing protein [Mariprofundaceae bacterium]|nr:HAMP domain-containing protein [Mariprofundaceae bacterium]
MLVGFTVMLAVLVLSLVILDMEREAWLKNQEAQAEVLVDRLADELKIPMLAGSSAEIELIIKGKKGFLAKVPDVLGVHVQYANGKDQHFGDIGRDDLLHISQDALLLNNSATNSHIARLTNDRLWYIKKVEYSGTAVGIVAVRYSEQAWKDLAGRLVGRMSIAATLVVLMSGVLVFWIAGRMSRPLEMLADAAQHVAHGDYSVRLPVSGNDEISDATTQFNVMVEELAHKEQIKDVFGRYLNPKLVSDVFEGGSMSSYENHRQEVTVLFADMVGFTAFSESTKTEEIVEVLNKHFEVFHRIIHYYGGHVDKYIGDAVMAVFNHPNEDPDHVRHSVMAGLAMVVACSKLGVLRGNGEPIQFRVGLNYGEAIVGNIGAAERLEYTVIGDTVNVASRMGGLGEGGEVVCSHTTFAQLGGDEFAFDEMGVRDIKGVSKPIRCGTIRAAEESAQRNIAHAVALAFDLTLPSDVRDIIGDL